MDVKSKARELSRVVESKQGREGGLEGNKVALLTVANHSGSHQPQPHSVRCNLNIPFAGAWQLAIWREN